MSTSLPDPQTRQDDPGPRRGIIAAFLVGGFLLVGLSIVANRLQHRPAARAPRVSIVTENGANVTNPVAIRFTTAAPLQNTPQGWSAGDLHPHVLVDSTMIMPMGGDIAVVAADTFELRLPHLASGTHTVRIFWADASHRAIGDSASIPIVVVR